MSDVFRSEKTKFNGDASKATTTAPHTPPRTPTLNATAARTLASEVRDIHHALSVLPDLEPGDEINTLLTRLVSMCVIPYNADFVDYFFSIDGIETLCKELRTLCATAEGELERFWASKIIDESVELQGNSLITKL